MDKTYAVLAGLDWADEKHDVCWQCVHSQEVHHRVIKHSASAINEWVNELLEAHPEGRVAICLEQKRGAVVNALMEYDQVDLYPVNPVTLADYRHAFQPSGAKDDPVDAKRLLELLRLHPEELTQWVPDTAPTRRLRVLCEDRRKLVDQRNRICNSLRSKLKEYYPLALDLVGEHLYSPMCCAFLMKWPCYADLHSAQAAMVRRFYYKLGSRSEKRISERIERIAQSEPLCTDAAVIEPAMLWVKTMVIQIRGLNQAIATYDRQIQEIFRAHPDAMIFASFPGAGKHMAPRLLTGFGTDRTRFASSKDVATYGGVAPVIERSGKSEWVHWRWHCPKFIRQSFVEFASHSIGFSSWAHVYYHEQRKRGKGHQAAVRALAYKWIRILYRCWKTRTPYNEDHYIAALQRSGSWITNQMASTS